MLAQIPLTILDQIGRHCPRAMATFAMCAARANENNKIIFTKEQITDDLSESYTKFKNDLKALAKEGILEWHEKQGHIVITIGDLE